VTVEMLTVYSLIIDYKCSTVERVTDTGGGLRIYYKQTPSVCTFDQVVVAGA